MPICASCWLKCQCTLLAEANLLQAGRHLSPPQSQRPMYAADWRQASLSSTVSDANLHCWLRLICCRRASLSSVLSDANCFLLCYKTACLWSADHTARQALSLSFSLLSCTSLCSKTWRSLSHSLLQHSLSSVFPSVIWFDSQGLRLYRFRRLHLSCTLNR